MSYQKIPFLKETFLQRFHENLCNTFPAKPSYTDTQWPARNKWAGCLHQIVRLFRYEFVSF
jgi:hypothetical protein